jgi:hypothetical protein
MMNLIGRMRSPIFTGVALVVTVSTVIGARRHAAAQQPAAATCTRAEYHEFDFFLGDWDVYDVGASTVKAHNTVTPMLAGCAVREVYRRADGYAGESFSMYDAPRGHWHQSWVTNRGELLLLDGGLKDGTMVLTGSEAGENGASSVIRGVWLREDDGSVRETAQRSIDGGKSWSPEFDIVMRRARRP